MIIPQSFKRLTIDGNLTFRQITQRIQHQPTHLTIRTLKTLTRPCTTLPQSRSSITQKHTQRRNWTRLTQRRFRRTHNRTQFHNRLIPHHRRTVEPPAFRHTILWQHLPRQCTLSRTRRTAKRLHTKENPRKHPANIRIYHRDALAECETHHCAGRVIADPRQSQQLIVCSRQLIAIVGSDHTSAFLQAQRAPRVPKPAPGSDHIRFRRTCKRSRIRPTLHPIVPIRHHTAHLRLLAHHLGNKHTPWRGTAESPRKVTRRSMPPFGERDRHSFGVFDFGIIPVRVVHRTYSCIHDERRAYQ